MELLCSTFLKKSWMIFEVHERFIVLTQFCMRLLAYSHFMPNNRDGAHEIVVFINSKSRVCV